MKDLSEAIRSSSSIARYNYSRARPTPLSLTLPTLSIVSDNLPALCDQWYSLYTNLYIRDEKNLHCWGSVLFVFL